MHASQAMLQASRERHWSQASLNGGAGSSESESHAAAAARASRIANVDAESRRDEVGELTSPTLDERRPRVKTDRAASDPFTRGSGRSVAVSRSGRGGTALQPARARSVSLVAILARSSPRRGPQRTDFMAER